jgi:DNA recombination protein RmuC
MGINSGIGLLVLLVVIIHIIVSILYIAKNKVAQEGAGQKFIDYEKRLDKNEASMREEFGRNREETNKSAKDSREELSASLKSLTESFNASSKDNREELNKSINGFQEKVSGEISSFKEKLNIELKSVQDTVAHSTRQSREELANSLKTFEEKFSSKIEALTKDTNQIFEKNRETIEKKLGDIQKDNSEKLEKMRATVDEKLHKTLETRLGESFKLVSDQLQNVQKGLGEMQNLAVGVGDLKKVLSNVKTKGVLGEYQLNALLEQLLARHQYEQNVKTKEGSRDNVEFAIKIPSKSDSEKSIWLPIDSKFPTADYETLLTAYDNGDAAVIDRSKKDLENKIKKFAKDIHEKYIDPPNTTDFAIMFLPFEGLYAEVLRIPGLFEGIQKEFKITIAGPTTISAFINSLQMGFHTLAVQKRTSEIRATLIKVENEFGKLEGMLEKAKKKIAEAGAELDKTAPHTRKIKNNLNKVQEMPDADNQELPGIDDEPLYIETNEISEP